MHEIKGVRLEEYEYYVNKLRQNVVWKHEYVKLWRYKQRKPNTKDGIYHWMNPPPWNVFCVRHGAGERDDLIKAGVKAFSNHTFAKSFHSSIWSSCTNTASPFTVTTRIVSCCIPSTAQMKIFIECKAPRQSCVTFPTLIYLCPVDLQMKLWMKSQSSKSIAVIKIKSTKKWILLKIQHHLMVKKA